ncbi:MAG: putative porin [Neptuniibacter pectenicola]|jgi:predicted porin
MLMKKSLIALAVAGAMTAPMIAQADATLYGSFRIGLQQESDVNGVDGTDRELDVADQSSRVGIKGDVDLGLDGTKGLFHWEANVSTADSNSYGATTGSGKSMFGERLAYIGAKGDWGKALIGRQYHPHYLLIQAPTNVFNPSSGDYGERFNLGNTYHKRTDNSIAYYSPSMNGFTFIAGAVVGSSGDDSDNAFDETVDGYNIAGVYTANNFTVAASYGDVESSDAPAGDDSKEVWGLSAKYTMDALELMAKYEEADTEVAGANTAEESVWELAARYTVGDTSFYGRYSDYEDDVAGGLDLDQFGLGIQQKLGNGRVFLEHVNNDGDDTQAGDRTVAGYRLDF